MKLVFAVDSFKGSMSSEEINTILMKKATECFENCYCSCIPIADGGEGTLEAILKVVKGELIYVKVNNPLFEKLEAPYAILEDGTAIIEMAAASGISLIPYKDGNALITSTYGTGELIRDALGRGCRQINIAIGGSSTNDGGMGAMDALGIKFLDHTGKQLKPIGMNLEKVCSIDSSELDDRVKHVKIQVLCDVNNPLIGENGATRVFGIQKGAVGKFNDDLERGMINYAKALEKYKGKDISRIPGTGAAGGLGAALYTFLNAEIVSGIEKIFETIKFKELIQDADLIITGEGKIDEQSCYGKVLSGIGKMAMECNIPVIALTGSMGKGAKQVLDIGIGSIMTTVNGVMDIDYALTNARKLLEEAAERLFKIIRIGYEMR